MTTTATPKIVGKALYLELVADPTLDSDEARSLLGWQHGGTKQVLVFPEYQDDTGKVHEPVIMTRLVSTHSPRAQWDTTRVHSKPKSVKEDVGYGGYVSYEMYKTDEWTSLTEMEKHTSRKTALDLALRSNMIGSMWATDPANPTGDKISVAKQGWIVREGKPISIEITDQDMSELHDERKTPQAVIRRINKVRGTLDKFPEKLA